VGILLHRKGMMERLFAFWFQQFCLQSDIWEDPRVDLQALKIQPDRPHTHVVRRCNALNLFGA